MLRTITEEVVGVEEVKVSAVEGVEEVKVSSWVEVEMEVVEEVKKVQTTRRGRIIRQRRKM